MSYQGLIVPVPLGQAGLTGTTSLTRLDPGHLTVFRNGAYLPGGIAKEGGSAKLNSTAIVLNTAVLAGHDWWPSATVQRAVVVMADGTIRKDDGAGGAWTTLASGIGGLSLSPPPVMVEAGAEAAGRARKLFIFGGAVNPHVLPGDSAGPIAQIAFPPSDWAPPIVPIAGTVHVGRLWGWGNSNDPHRLYYSAVTDHEDFRTASGAGSLSVFPGDGGTLEAAVSFKGLLVAWKRPRGIYVVDTAGPDPAQWSVQRLTGEVGIAGPRAFALLEDDVIFLDASGQIQLLSAVQATGGLATTNLVQAAELGPFLRSTFDQARLRSVQAIYYAHKREVHFAWTRAGSSVVNDARLVLDLSATPPRFRTADKDVCGSLWLRRDTDGIPRPAAGDNVGFVWLLDRAIALRDGTSYATEARTIPLDFAFADPALGPALKNLDFVELVAEPLGGSILLDLYADGRFRQSLVFDLTSSVGDPLGTSTILNSWTLKSGAPVTRVRRRTAVRFNTMEVRLTAASPFSISSVVFYLRPGGPGRVRY